MRVCLSLRENPREKLNQANSEVKDRQWSPGPEVNGTETKEDLTAIKKEPWMQLLQESDAPFPGSVMSVLSKTSSKHRPIVSTPGKIMNSREVHSMDSQNPGGKDAR